MNEAVEQRTYLIQVLDRTGWTQTELASRAGLDPSTLSRFLSGNRHGHALRASTIRKIEMISGIATAANPGARAADTSAPPGFAEPEAVPLDMSAETPLAAVIAALMRGRANLDAWTLKSRALESAGYRPGDILLVGLNETPVVGDVVCAQVYDWTIGRAETVFRLFQPPYLIAATADPALLRPHVVDNSRVVIKGVVLSSLRGRTGAT